MKAVPQGVVEGNEAAEGVGQQGDLGVAQVGAQGVEILRQLREPVGLRGSLARAAAASIVMVDQGEVPLQRLQGVAQVGEGRMGSAVADVDGRA